MITRVIQSSAVAICLLLILTACSGAPGGGVAQARTGMTGLWLGQFQISEDTAIGCISDCPIHTAADGYFLASFFEQPDGTFSAANSNACAEGSGHGNGTTGSGKGQMHFISITGLRTANHVLNYSQVTADPVPGTAQGAGFGIPFPTVRFETPDVKGSFDGQTAVFPSGTYSNSLGQFTILTLKLSAVDTEDQYNSDCAALLK